MIEREAARPGRALPASCGVGRADRGHAATSFRTRAGSARPTLATELRPDSALLREEVFGPLLTIEAVADVEAACEIVDGLRSR